MIQRKLQFLFSYKYLTDGQFTETKTLRTGILIAGGAVLLLLASITILSAALENWLFTSASNYTFDSNKIEINDGQAILKLYPPTVVHDEKTILPGPTATPSG